jgi:hypothetical protein
VDIPAIFLSSAAAFKLPGVGVVTFEPPCPTVGVTGGIDVAGVALGSGSSTKRIEVVVKARDVNAVFRAFE